MTEGTPLRKMIATLAGDLTYGLYQGNTVVDMGSFIGQEFSLRATGQLSCIVCGRQVPKFYGQGFCFPCFRNAPEASECIIRPELCRAHLGEGRDPQWERDHHDTEHVVYLSHTGGVKVGVTRSTQMPVRWIDQGAVTALVVARTPNRHLSGLIEMDLKRAFADRTDWRAMLRDVQPEVGRVLEARDRASMVLCEELRQYLVRDAQVLSIHYPVLAYPPKVTSVQLARTPEVRGRLLGIKGQYLIWEDGRVLNVRNHAGYHATFG